MYTQRVRNVAVASANVCMTARITVSTSYIATLMRTGDPEKQLMYSLERHCNTTARCSLHTTSGELRLMTEIIRTPVFIGLRATQEVKRAS